MLRAPRFGVDPLLDSTWKAIREHHPDLPDAVITLGQGSDPRRPGTLKRGHWATGRWTSETGKDHHEVMLAGERLADGPEGVLATLLHEAAHALAHRRGIEDTSRRGHYHNARFKALAEELLLDVDRAGTRGWTATELTDAARERYEVDLGWLLDAIHGYRLREDQILKGGPAGTGSGPAGTRRRKSRLCYRWRCTPPRKLYAAPGIAELGPIVYGLCERAFAAAE